MRPVTAHVSRILAAPTSVRLPPGAEWCEAVISAGVLGFGGPPHGHPSRWDWGLTVYTLGLAFERHRRMQALYDQLTPDQRDALWSDASPVAAELRGFAR